MAEPLREQFSHAVLEALVGAGGELDQTALLLAMPEDWEHITGGMAVTELRKRGLIEQIQDRASHDYLYRLTDPDGARELLEQHRHEQSPPEPEPLGPRSRPSSLSSGRLRLERLDHPPAAPVAPPEQDLPHLGD